MRSLLGLSAALLALAAAAAEPARDVEVPGRMLRTALPPSPGRDVVAVERFGLDRRPVTNGELAAFVADRPEWRRDRVPALFADARYLAHWPTPDAPAAADLDRPVTHVSWFAATAYCEARGQRLPSWYEWELVAAASETRTDARDDPEWRQRILGLYTRPAGAELQHARHTPLNAYGIGDLHGVVSEWIEDFNGLLVSVDNRNQGDPETMRFCGAGAVSMEQKEHYAVLMRIAMLSSLAGNDTGPTLGFRCARDLGVGP